MENELRIVDAVSVPVLAAGGITDVRGVRAARALGAEGFYIGSRFIVTKENRTAENAKVKIISSTVEDMVLVAPQQRSIRNAKMDELAKRFADGDHDTFAETRKMGGTRTAMLEGKLEDGDITVSQELSYIRDYIQIQKARFRDKIQANIAVEPALMPVMIPKLILQPIVENAFIHGLEEKNGNGTIKISGILNDEEETVLFMIHDNGVGMTRAQIEKALDPPPGTKGSFGLSSVHKRLQLLYGTDFGLKILSDPGKGTTIIIRMPLHVEKAEKEKQ